MMLKKVLPVVALVCAVALVGFKSGKEGAKVIELTETDVNDRYYFEYDSALPLPDGFTPVGGQLSKNGKKLFVALEDKNGTRQAYVMVRESLFDSFGKPERLAGKINDLNYRISSLSATSDEKVVVFVGNETGQENGEELYTAIRTVLGRYDNIRKVDEINSEDIADISPWISDDGLRLYFTKKVNGEYNWYWAYRFDVYGKFKKMRTASFEATHKASKSTLQFLNREKEALTLSGNEVFVSYRRSVYELFPPLMQVHLENQGGEISNISMADNKLELFAFNTKEDGTVEIHRFVNTSPKAGMDFNELFEGPEMNIRFY